MKERPILFSGPMVRAILTDTKTHTRRVIKNPEKFKGIRDCAFCCPYGDPGDRLWVRETWMLGPTEHPADACVIYRATDPGWDENWTGLVWKPSIHMPRRLSRITLEICSVRVERVQEITEEDARAEGYPHRSAGNLQPVVDREYLPLAWYRHIWDEINAKRGYPWESNPWVFVIEFRRAEAGADRP